MIFKKCWSTVVNYCGLTTPSSVRALSCAVRRFRITSRRLLKNYSDGSGVEVLPLTEYPLCRSERAPAGGRTLAAHAVAASYDFVIISYYATVRRLEDLVDGWRPWGFFAATRAQSALTWQISAWIGLIAVCEHAMVPIRLCRREAASAPRAPNLRRGRAAHSARAAERHRSVVRDHGRAHASSARQRPRL
jgi:hypothetical protein